MTSCLICHAEMSLNATMTICNECYPIAEKHRNSIAIQSTGNIEQDQAHHKRAVISATRMERGLCPNGCGPITRPAPGETHCPRCGFIGFTRVLRVE